MKLALILILATKFVFADLVIVHPSRTWDPLMIAKEGIERAVQKARSKNQNIYLLKHSDQLIYRDYPTQVDSYYIKDQNDFKIINSEEGENLISTSKDEITFVGGYLEFCLSHAIAHVLNNSQKRIKVNIFLPGVFAHGESSTSSVPDIAEDFELSSIWPYPVNPGFIRLERQVQKFHKCPSKRFIYNSMFSYGGDYPSLGNGPTPEHFNYTYSCNDEQEIEFSIGDGGENLIHFNFITD